MKYRTSRSSRISYPRAVPAALVLSVAFVAGCTDSSGPGGGGGTAAPDNTVASVAVTPAADTLTALGLTSQFTASATNSSGGVVAGKTFTWTSSSTGVATVSTAGLGTAVANGSTNISAAVDGITGVATLVVAQTVSSVTVTPASDTLVSLGETVQLAAAVVDAQGNDVSSATVTWMSSDMTIATVSTAGLVTAVANGSAMLMAMTGTAADTATVTVTQVAASVSVAPAADTLVALDDTLRLSATVSDAGDNSISDAAVTWASSDASVATVDTAGLVTAVANGSVSITATSGTAVDTGTVVVAQVAASVSVSAGDQQSAVTGTAVATAPAVEILDANDHEVAGVPVAFAVASGGGSVTGAVDTTNSDGVATVGSWTVGATAGANTLTATATGTGITGNPITFTGTGVTTLFDIEVRYVAGTTPSAAQQTAYDNAIGFWRTALVGDLVDIPTNVAAGTCGGVSAPAVSETIDDLVIFVSFEDIDGAGGTLASAGPCFIRTQGKLPIMGGMKFDNADLAILEAGNDLEGTIRHEMGHVLGFGTLWDDLALLKDPSDTTDGGTVGADTHFDGAQAITAFDAVGGGSYAGAKVPVENDTDTFGSGSLDSHWRESIFDTELMTPFLDAGVLNAASTVTIASFEDMGFTVNSSVAESYTLPGPARVLVRRGTLRLINDVWQGPIYEIDASGVIVGVFRR